MKQIRGILPTLRFAVFFIASILVLPTFAVEPSQSETTQTHLRAATRSLNLQTSMPDGKVEAQPVDHYNPNNSRGALLSDSMAQALLWFAIGIAAITILMTIRDNLWSTSRSRRLVADDAVSADAEALVTRMDKAQIAADDLAQQGSFAEAMHVLLLQSVGEMRQRLDISIASSLTSREILHRIGLPPAGRAALADIISRVEISYFGSHQPQAEEYDICRRSFMALTESLRTRAPA